MSVRLAVAAGPCCLLFRTSTLGFCKTPSSSGFPPCSVCVRAVPVPAALGASAGGTSRSRRFAPGAEEPRAGGDAELSLSPVILGDPV